MRTLYSDFYAIKEQLAIQFQASNRMKKIRHDIKNHLYSVGAFIENGEYDKAKEMLENESHGSIRSVANQVGYEDVYHFSKLFKKYYGLSPLNYSKKIVSGLQRDEK